ncbi:MAG: isoaspartyl peptidase/L-asparaginase [Pseudomonadota bacterium]
MAKPDAQRDAQPDARPLAYPYLLALHGGAGSIAPSFDAAPFHAALRAAAAVGEALLAGGASALDAVVAVVAALEDCILFNAGRGSVYGADAHQEMDASVMDGATRAAGCVAGVRSVANPVLLARAVMQSSGCVMLVGAGAEQFARDAGFPFTPPEYFASPARLEQLRRVQGAGASRQGHSGDYASAPLDEVNKLGTVGAVARDRAGNLASAVSTGGLTNKRPGRVGDTPIFGAGCYADNASVAVAATGTGEHFMRSVLAYDIAARMRYGGAALADAASAAIGERLAPIGGQGGVIAIGRDGALAMPFNTSGMYRASVREGQAIVSAIFQ